MTAADRDKAHHYVDISVRTLASLEEHKVEISTGEAIALAQARATIALTYATLDAKETTR